MPGDNDAMSILRISLVNRYYPPNPSVTGQEASKLAGKISTLLNGSHIDVFHVKAPYGGGVAGGQVVGQPHPIASIYNGKVKLMRFFGNFLEGPRLLGKALDKTDLLIAMTDPPLLNYWAGKKCKKAKTPWLFWSMDLYPQAFVAAGLAGPNNLLVKYFLHSIKRCPPDFLLALGVQQARFIQNALGRELPYTVLPCGIHGEPKSESPPSWRQEDDKLYFGYIGNLGEAHDLRFVAEIARQLNPNRHRLVLSLYGSGAGKLIKEIGNLPVVVQTPSVSRGDLGYIDVHIVSLLSRWTHICVPSKAVSAVCAGGIILFSGSEDSDNWQMLHKAGFIMREPYDSITLSQEIAGLLKRLQDPALVQAKKKAAVSIKEELLNMERKAYETLASWIRTYVH